MTLYHLYENVSSFTFTINFKKVFSDPSKILVCGIDKFSTALVPVNFRKGDCLPSENFFSVSVSFFTPLNCPLLSISYLVSENEPSLYRTFVVIHPNWTSSSIEIT